MLAGRKIGGIGRVCLAYIDGDIGVGRDRGGLLVGYTLDSRGAPTCMLLLNGNRWLP